MQLQLTVDAMNPLVVPPVSLSPQQAEQLAKSVSGIAVGQPDKRLDNVGVVARCRCIGIQRPTDEHYGACLTHAQPELIASVVDDLPLLGCLRAFLL